MSGQHEPAVGIPAPEVPRGARIERRHRRPRMVPFLATGAVLGSFFGMLVVVFGPEVDDVGIARETIILCSIGALLGGLLGAIVYLVVERFTAR